MNDARKTRILMIDSETTWRGGEGQLELLMRGLIKRGDFDVTLAACAEAAITDKAHALGVRCLPLSISSDLDISAAWTLSRYLREGRYDLVHCHSSHAHGIAFLADRASRFWRNDSVSERPRLVVSRRVDFRVAKNGLSGLKYRYGADVYIAISNGVRDALLESGIGPERIVIVRSGIDLNKFAEVKNNRYLSKEFGLEDSTPVIGNVAALAPHKSQADLVLAADRVVNEIPEAKFLIVGEGELRPHLEKLISKLGLEGKVLLTGFRTDALEIMSRFNCFVLSSYLEGLCTSIMDAQAMGVPVVATRTGGVPELVEDGVSGLLVAPRRPHEMADAIIRMIREPSLGQSCAEAAMRKARSYDSQEMVRDTIGVYQQILRRTVGVH